MNIIINEDEQYLKLEDIIGEKINNKILINLLNKTDCIIMDEKCNKKDTYENNDTILVKYNWCIVNVENFKDKIIKDIEKYSNRHNLKDLISYYKKTKCDIKYIKEYYKPIEGYVYVIKNKMYDKNIYKIGQTKNLKGRINAYKTGYIEESEIEHTDICIDKVFGETFVFNKLKNNRIKTNREFFQIEYTKIKEVFNELNNLWNDIKTKEELIDYVIKNKINLEDDNPDKIDNTNEIELRKNIINNTIESIIENRKEDDIERIYNKIIKKLKMNEIEEEIYNKYYIKDIIRTRLQLSNKKKDNIEKWFKDTYEYTGEKTDILKIKDLFSNISTIKNITYNKADLKEYIKNNSFFLKYYKERSDKHRCFLRGWKLKVDNNNN